jgi:prephenate dehydrogenase
VEKSDRNAIKKVQHLFESVGMHTTFRDADEHDRQLAYVSHLSHVSSFMLGLTVLNMEKNEENIFNLAGSGFESTVRLAKSSPDFCSKQNKYSNCFEKLY